jgi:hypothetical protein
MISIQKAKVADRSAVWQCCNGRRKTASGFIWRYAESEETK